VIGGKSSVWTSSGTVRKGECATLYRYMKVENINSITTMLTVNRQEASGTSSHISIEVGFSQKEDMTVQGVIYVACSPRTTSISDGFGDNFLIFRNTHTDTLVAQERARQSESQRERAFQGTRLIPSSHPCAFIRLEIVVSRSFMCSCVTGNVDGVAFCIHV